MVFVQRSGIVIELDGIISYELRPVQSFFIPNNAVNSVAAQEVLAPRYFEFYQPLFTAWEVRRKEIVFDQEVSKFVRSSWHGAQLPFPRMRQASHGVFEVSLSGFCVKRFAHLVQVLRKNRFILISLPVQCACVH